MLNIQITIGLDENTVPTKREQAILSSLSGLTESSPAMHSVDDEPTATPVPEASTNVEPEADEPKAEDKKPAPVRRAPARRKATAKPAPAKKAVTPEPEAEEPQEDPEDAPEDEDTPAALEDASEPQEDDSEDASEDELKQATKLATEMVKAGKRDEVKAALKAVGAPRVSDLKASQAGPFIEALDDTL